MKRRLARLNCGNCVCVLIVVSRVIFVVVVYFVPGSFIRRVDRDFGDFGRS